MTNTACTAPAAAGVADELPVAIRGAFLFRYSMYAWAIPSAALCATCGSGSENETTRRLVSTGMLIDKPRCNSSSERNSNSDAIDSTAPDDAIPFSVPITKGCRALPVDDAG